MRLSFDTEHDKLDETLAVLSAAYGVSLSTGGSTGSRARRATKSAAPARTRKRTAAKTTARKRTARKSSARKTVAPARKRAARQAANGAVRTADVRAWANGQGIKVSDRGRLSADLIARYVAATA